MPHFLRLRLVRLHRHWCDPVAMRHLLLIGIGSWLGAIVLLFFH